MNERLKCCVESAVKIKRREWLALWFTELVVFELFIKEWVGELKSEQVEKAA